MMVKVLYPEVHKNFRFFSKRETAFTLIVA